MLALIIFLATLALAAGAFLETRGFVRRRLRFVDAIQTPFAPILAGLLTALVAAPVVWILPFVGAGTAIGLGLAVGSGVAAGARDVKSGRLLHE